MNTEATNIKSTMLSQISPANTEMATIRSTIMKRISPGVLAILIIRHTRPYGKRPRNTTSHHWTPDGSSPSPGAHADAEEQAAGRRHLGPDPAALDRDPGHRRTRSNRHWPRPIVLAPDLVTPSVVDQPAESPHSASLM